MFLRKRLITRVFSNNLNDLFKREMIDVYNFSHVNKINYKDYVKFEGIENLEHVKDTPLILYTCHFGRFVLPLICLAKIFRPMGCIINDASGVPYSERLFRSFKLNLMEKHMKSTFFYTNKRMLKIFKFLKQNGMLVYLVDIEAKEKCKNSFWINFLNRKMLIYSTIIRLTSRTNARLIPYIAFESEDGMYPINCKIMKEIKFNKDDSNEVKMKKILKPLELINEKKDQWWISK